MAKAANKSTTRIPLREYFYGKAYPEGEPSLPESPDDPQQLAEWDQTWKAARSRRGALEATAWQQIKEEAIAGEISVEALCIENPQREEMMEGSNSIWYPKYYQRWNVRKIIPSEFFKGDVLLGPGHPVVIYYAKGTPFAAPWADPVVILKPRAAKAYARKACVQWLAELRRGPQDQIKAWYEMEALARFGVTGGQFQGVWDDAAEARSNAGWGKRGARKKNRVK